MEEIRVMEKPEWVSWNDIHELLLQAHEKNLKKGIVMQTTTLSGDDLKEHLGEDGRCFVAFVGEKLVGTTSVRIGKGGRWFDRGKIVAKGAMSAILQQYQGLGLLEEMNVLRDKYVAERKVQLLEGDTPENNIVLRKIVSKKGFKEVRFFAAQHQNHFSVCFVKWVGECPFSERYIKFRFNLSRFLTKLQYKKGKIERNKLLSFFCKVVNFIDAKI